MNENVFHKVTQTRLGAPAGNCTEAAIASVLGCAIEEVPQLWGGDMEDYADPQPAENWQKLIEWCRERDREFIKCVFQRYYQYPLAGNMNNVVARNTCHEHYLLFGKSSRGLGHAVVAKEGEIVWDPHPSREGLLSVFGFAVLWSRERLNSFYEEEYIDMFIESLQVGSPLSFEPIEIRLEKGPYLGREPKEGAC